MNTVLNQRVRDLLEELIGSGQEVGLQVAAYRGEELIVDTWAGLASETPARAVDGDTLFTCWSVTKGLTATCLHLLIDRGTIDYETRVATVWPEFAAGDKHEVTIRNVLMHTAGVPQLPADVTHKSITDWTGMCRSIASLDPLWAPGTQVAYHAWTFGWIAGEIVRQADGRPISAFVQRELCQPLGNLDLYLGIPDSEAHRVADVRHDSNSGNSPAPSELHRRVLPPAITCADTINRPEIRRAALPATGGIMNARAIAKHYAMLANGGEFGGVRLLHPARIALVASDATNAEDAVLAQRIRRGLGYCLGGTSEVFGDERMGTSGTEFGHPGLGGSMGFADPEKHFSFGLAKTLLKSAEDKKTSAVYQIAELIRGQL